MQGSRLQQASADDRCVCDVCFLNAWHSFYAHSHKQLLKGHMPNVTAFVTCINRCEHVCFRQCKYVHETSNKSLSLENAVLLQELNLSIFSLNEHAARVEQRSSLGWSAFSFCCCVTPFPHGLSC